MSMMMKVRSRVTSRSKAAAPAPSATTGQDRNYPNTKPILSGDEPQEDSVRGTEAPESWHESHVEAPDAGRGVSHSFIENDYTHGRSRS
jgi:hypothetical protein